jgi:hypothetical protein
MLPVIRACDYSTGRGGSAAMAEAARAVSKAAAVVSVRIMVKPQRIMLEVVDSIWSAAVMTLAFIS